VIIFHLLLIFSSKSSLSRTPGSGSGNECEVEPCPPTAPAPTHFTNFGNWSNSQCLTEAYPPILLTALINSVWDTIYTRFKEMEPFIQLSQAGGAATKASFLLRYSSISLPETLYHSLLHRHGYVALAFIISLALTVSVPIASEVLYIHTSGDCTSTSDGKECDPVLAFHKSMGYLEATLFGACFFALLILSINYGRRRNLIRNEPFSISGLAVFLNNTAFVQSLQCVSRTTPSHVRWELGIGEYLGNLYYIGNTEGADPIRVLHSASRCDHQIRFLHCPELSPRTKRDQSLSQLMREDRPSQNVR
jgi:hypothetical protein